MNDHESTKRVLFHVVNTYQSWRTQNSLGVPNEFTDDAVRIGEQHLREVDWFPADEGWLSETKDSHEPLWYDHAQLKPAGSPLELIDVELKRLREPVNARDSSFFGRRRRGWVDGLTAAREVAARQLQEIRDAYIVEQLTRETEALRLYGLSKEDDQ